LIEIINKQLLLQLVGYLCYWQMGFNSVFKGLSPYNVNNRPRLPSLHLETYRSSNLITVQQDATYSVYYISVGSSTYFGC